jgi:hypothetical protein
MHIFAAAGAGFLLAVLWFDLMFDVQTRKHTGDLLFSLGRMSVVLVLQLSAR